MLLGWGCFLKSTVLALHLVEILFINADTGYYDLAEHHGHFNRKQSSSQASPMVNFYIYLMHPYPRSPLEKTLYSLI